MIVRRARLVRLERLGRRPHREDKRRREHLLDQGQGLGRRLAQEQRAARLHTGHGRLGYTRAEDPRRTLIVLEKSIALEPIRMESNLEPPSQPIVHKLGVLRRHKTHSHRPPHVRHEGVVLDRHTRQVACGALAHDTRPLEHLGERARDVVGLTPALRQAVHVRACAPIERHRSRAECHGVLT